MSDNNPFKKTIKAVQDLTRLNEIAIPGETTPLKSPLIQKTYDTTFTARLTKDTHNKIMHIKNHPDPDFKRSLGVIIEQAVDLYLAKKGIDL